MDVSVYVWDHFYWRLTIYVMLVLWVVLEAMKEGWFKRGDMMWSKQAEMGEKVLFVLMLHYLPHSWLHEMWVVLAYGLLRYALFDIFYNAFARLPFLYFGSTTWFYDQWIGPFKTKYPSFYLSTCLIAICVAFGFIFQELKLN